MNPHRRLLLASLPAGVLGARWGSRRFMLVGLGLMLAGCVLFPLADTLAPSGQLPWLIGFGILIYLGLAIYFVNTAPLLLQAVPAERRIQVIAVAAVGGGGGSWAWATISCRTASKRGERATAR